MKRLISVASAVALSLTSAWALAQTPAPVPSDAAAAAKVQKKAEFAATEKTMQEASGPCPIAPASSQAERTKAGGKTAMESEMVLQQHKGSPEVDLNCPAAAPQKKISDMTPAERAQVRKEVVEGAKP